MGSIIRVTQSSMPPYEEYIEKIKPLWDSHWLTNMGEYHQEFEESLKDYLGVPELSLMTNGHMALELAIQAMNFPEGSEVITTPFTFVSTTHAIVRNRLKPIFCDIREDNYTIDETKIESLITENTVAIVPVHVYGNLCNVEAIEKIAFKYNLKVIYDAAHAFGENYKGTPIGNYGDASIFSFHATKVFNSVEGGAVTFSDPKLYTTLYNLKNFGIRSEELVVGVGANAKMNEFSAIMGTLNLQYVDENIAKRKQVTEWYLEELGGLSKVKTLSYDESENRLNYGYFPAVFESEEIRDRIYDALRKEDIYSRKYFYPLTSDAACFRNRYQNVPLEVARSISNRVLVLPLYPELAREDVKRICKTIVSLV